MTRRHGYRGRAKAKYNYVRLPVRHRVNAVTRVINDADARAREPEVCKTRPRAPPRDLSTSMSLVNDHARARDFLQCSDDTFDLPPPSSSAGCTGLSLGALFSAPRRERVMNASA